MHNGETYRERTRKSHPVIGTRLYFQIWIFKNQYEIPGNVCGEFLRNCGKYVGPSKLKQAVIAIFSEIIHFSEESTMP